MSCLWQGSKGLVCPVENCCPRDSCQLGSGHSPACPLESSSRSEGELIRAWEVMAMQGRRGTETWQGRRHLKCSNFVSGSCFCCFLPRACMPLTFRTASTMPDHWLCSDQYTEKLACFLLWVPGPFRFSPAEHLLICFPEPSAGITAVLQGYLSFITVRINGSSFKRLIGFLFNHPFINVISSDWVIVLCPDVQKEKTFAKWPLV